MWGGGGPTGPADAVKLHFNEGLEHQKADPAEQRHAQVHDVQALIGIRAAQGAEAGGHGNGQGDEAQQDGDADDQQDRERRAGLEGGQAGEAEAEEQPEEDGCHGHLQAGEDAGHDRWHVQRRRPARREDVEEGLDQVRDQDHEQLHVARRAPPPARAGVDDESDRDDDGENIDDDRPCAASAGWRFACRENASGSFQTGPSPGGGRWGERTGITDPEVGPQRRGAYRGKGHAELRRVCQVRAGSAWGGASV